MAMICAITFNSELAQAKDELKINIDNVGSVTAPMPGLVTKEITALNDETSNKEVKTSNSQVNGSLIYNDFKDLAKHYGTKADTLLTQAFSILSSTTAEIWDILVTQQRVKSLYGLTLILLEIFLFYRWIKYFNKYLELPEEEKSENYQAALGFTFIVLVAFGIYNSTQMLDIYTGLLNPKYAAIKDILEMSTKILK